MTCKAFTEAVTDYIESDLRFTLWLHYEMHLGMCAGCRIYLRQMKQTISALSRLPSSLPPLAVRTELLQRFRTWRAR